MEPTEKRNGLDAKEEIRTAVINALRELANRKMLLKLDL